MPDGRVALVEVPDEGDEEEPEEFDEPVEDVEPTVPPEPEPLPDADEPGAWFLIELVETSQHWLDVELLLLPGEVRPTRISVWLSTRANQKMSFLARLGRYSPC